MHAFILIHQNLLKVYNNIEQMVKWRTKLGWWVGQIVALASCAYVQFTHVLGIHIPYNCDVGRLPWMDKGALENREGKQSMWVWECLRLSTALSFNLICHPDLTSVKSPASLVSEQWLSSGTSTSWWVIWELGEVIAGEARPGEPDFMTCCSYGCTFMEGLPTHWGPY